MTAAYEREGLSRRANDIRARLSVSRVIGRVVKLEKAGREFVALCPFHEEQSPSFTICDRKGFFHCFGCGAHGSAIDFVMLRQGLDFRSAIELLEAENGLQALQASRPAPPAPKVAQRDVLAKDEAVQRIWDQTNEVKAGDAVDRYLRGRALVPPSDYGVGANSENAGWPGDLRFAPELWHGLEKRRMPGMVAAMRVAGRLVAVHRTYLAVTGVGVTKAGTKRDKAMFGNVGGAFIRLGPDGDRMVGGEGIETSLAAMQLYRRTGLAFGTAGAMETVEPPFGCTDFLYAADWNAKSRVGERAAWKGAKRFGRGREMSVKIPRLAREGHEKADFNDQVLVMQARPQLQHD